MSVFEEYGAFKKSVRMIILECLYKRVHYKMVLAIRRFKIETQKGCTQTKMYRLYRKNDHKWSFFYIYIFFFLHFCLDTTWYPNKNV